MLKFIKKITILLLLIIISDFVIGVIAQHFYFKVKSGDIYDANYGVILCKEDILIMGASEVAHGLISNQIADSTGLSCYNLARDGNNIYYQYFLLENILKRYSPRMIIISTMVLNESESTINNLLPYIRRYDDAKTMVNELKPIEYWKSFLKCYSYNSFAIKIIQGNLIENKTNLNGYLPLYIKSKNLKHTDTPYKIGISELTLSYYDKFLALCDRHGIKVFVINTPKYQKIYDVAEERKIETIITKNKSIYLDFSRDLTFNENSSLFKDRTHLNNDGAILLTNKLIKKINIYLLADTFPKL